MRSRTVTVWYCGHCSKRKFTRPAMEKHELSCTMNPERVCKMCKMAGLEQRSIAELIDNLPVWDSDQKDVAVRKASGNCPACLLAACRQAPAGLGMKDFHWRLESKAWIGTYSKPLDRSGYDY